MAKTKIEIPQVVSDIIQGLVGRLDLALEWMEDPDEPKSEFELETEEFIVNMGVAGFFQPMIVKIQLPLDSNEIAPPALVYTEDRSFCQTIPVSPELITLISAQPVPKIYAYARLWNDGNLQIVRQLEQQSW